MCGIAGFVDPGLAQNTMTAQGILEKMGNSIRHRGPDDGATWIDASGSAGFAHRRLSILDLSPAGQQPMVSPSGRFVISFNGEIYNHNALRHRLKGVDWRGHSDTETLLAAIEQWGVEETLRASVGMFAFALWDTSERKLTLARDRLGEKPLYYGWQSGVFLFGSELKALKAHPAFAGEIDRDALTLLLRHGSIASPHSIYKGVQKLPPGSFLELGVDQDKSFRCKSYWSLSQVAALGRTHPFSGSREEMIDELERLLNDAIQLQQIADVPLGAFLSGGIDSSTIAALMQATSSTKVKTFSIGFHEESYDEAKAARAVAQHLGTDHTELYVTGDDALAVVPKLSRIWDEPFSDSSQIPTYLVAGLARKKVTVALSGDGGDELFGGYERYFVAERLWNKLRLIPGPLRALGAKSLTQIAPSHWDSLIKSLPLSSRRQLTGDRIHKLAEVVNVHSRTELYRALISTWKFPSEVVLGAKEPSLQPVPDDADFLSHMMLADGLHYLPTDILTKVDRAAMAVSLETRVPLLDHRVIEFAWKIPSAWLRFDGKGKWPLRQILFRHVPREIVDRPKKGFSVPLADWLRGPLKEWAGDLLSEERLRREEFFAPSIIRAMWEEHLNGSRNWNFYLWSILMFQSWIDERNTNK